MGGLGDGGHGGGLGGGLAAEEADALDAEGAGGVDVGDDAGDGAGLAAAEGQVLGVAATGTTQRAALDPEGEAPPWALGLGAGHGEGDVDDVAVWGAAGGGAGRHAA